MSVEHREGGQTVSIQVSEAFADAVKEFFAAADAGGGHSPAAWEKVMQEGAKLFMKTTGEVARAGEAVINGEAIIYRSQIVDFGIGGGEAGFITAAGLASGLVVSAAVLFVAMGVSVAIANKRDMDATRKAAMETYVRQYIPRYLKFAFQRMTYGNRVPPAPFTFEEYFNFRGDRTVCPAKL